MGFGVEDKMIFEAEKKRRKRAGEMGSSYVLKSVVELELFSNLWYFKSYFFQLLYIYQESHTHPSLHFNPEPILLKYPNCPKKPKPHWMPKLTSEGGAGNFQFGSSEINWIDV